MVKKKVSENPAPKFAVRSAELPATQGMLQLVRTEVKADIRGLRSEMSARFNQIDARFNQVDARFSQLEARFSQLDSKFSSIDARFNENDAKFKSIDSRFDEVDSKLERVISEVSRIGLLVEEQNANNRVVLEGLTGLWQRGLWQRQERVETRMDGVEDLVRSIARSRS